MKTKMWGARKEAEVDRINNCIKIATSITLEMHCVIGLDGKTNFRNS
jgi:hypothetical protein